MQITKHIYLLSRHKDQKIGFFGRFFGEKSVFGWVGNDLGKEKSFVRKSAKNRRFFDISQKNPIFPRKKPMFSEIFDFFPVFSLAPKI